MISTDCSDLNQKSLVRFLTYTGTIYQQYSLENINLSSYQNAQWRRGHAVDLYLIVLSLSFIIKPSTFLTIDLRAGLFSSFDCDIV